MIPPRLAARLSALLPGPLRRSRWTIGLIWSPIDEIIRRRTLPAPTWLSQQPRNGFYADPFPLRIEPERVHLLVEHLDFEDRRGRIVELEVAHDGTLLRASDRLVPGYHVSYPFLLRTGDQVLCVPETYEAARADAFEMADGGWRPIATLLHDFPVVDATLIEHDGLWWLFCTRLAEHDKLFLFVADDWRGPFAPHPENPVKTDLASARPAGGLVAVDGELYRPAQDCTRTYGGAIAVNRVVELNRRRYREETLFTLRPDPASAWPVGMHTLNGLEGLTVVDAKRFEWAGWPR